MRALMGGGLAVAALVAACATGPVEASVSPSGAAPSSPTRATGTAAPSSASVAQPTATGAATATGATTSATSAAAPTPAAATSCVDTTLARLSPTARAGQLLLVGVPATNPRPTAAQLA